LNQYKQLFLIDINPAYWVAKWSSTRSYPFWFQLALNIARNN